jgi:hypothetical protein
VGDAAVAEQLDPGKLPGPSGPAPGRLSGLSVSHSKSVLCGAFMWARRGLNNQKRRFPARAGYGLPGGKADGHAA